ncbi:EAL domain-containing protein, partial [Undibacterium sp.]|uniref:EAL domain-containing protein n=1 Tax=Undibacterium sp. TaxID=1914977 RepID=UPI00374D0704
LLDLQMPDMNGFQVMEELKQIEPDGYFPVLVITAQPGHKLRALQAGAKDFISKPFDLTEVTTRIQNMLEVRLLYGRLGDYNKVLEQTVLDRTVELRRFRKAMDSTADAVFLLDREQFAIVDVNSAACHMLGYLREELLQLNPVALGKHSRSQLEAIYDRIIANGGESPGTWEMELQCKDGFTVEAEIHLQALLSGGRWIMVAVARDITERRATELRLQQLAHYDPLTGLANRTLLYETLQKGLVQAAVRQRQLAVLIIDLDYFKNINDTRGHAIGDELLRQFSHRLMQCVSVRDTVGRIGGDEFALILSLPLKHEDAAMAVSRIRDAMRLPFKLQGYETAATASIGIAMYPDDASDAETLMRYADTAMHQAKEAGRDTYRFFTAAMNLRILQRLDLENALRSAIDNKEFMLFYQPKVQLRTGRIVGVEALIRWNRPGIGVVSPGEFIPVLEETGMILQVGQWVIAEACRQIARWSMSAVGPISVSVNVSSRQFVEGDLESDVVMALRDNGVDPGLLELELTESSLMSDAKKTIEVLHHLKALGVEISVDDFGTGYSSLAYLKHFPLDKLKIDIAFIRDVTTNPDDAAIALAVINMAHSLKLQVVAEGVETEAQLAYLRRHRCDQIQGYYFSKPVAAQQLEQMLNDEKCLPMESIATQPQTLLIVDDDINVLAALKRMLRYDGYRVLTASSPSDAFELLALNAVHLVLCGQRMPGMSGTDFLDRVKNMYPDTFRIVLAGYSDLESIMDAINRGSIYRFYTKPWDNKILRTNIRAAFLHYWQLHGMETDSGDLAVLPEDDEIMVKLM